MPVHRLFVGGLPGDITEHDVIDRFSSLGRVHKVDIVPSKDPLHKGSNTAPSQLAERTTPVIAFANVCAGECRGFAYIDLESSDIERCIKTYNSTKWKGKTLKVQLAKLHYRTRLENEWVSEIVHFAFL